MSKDLANPIHAEPEEAKFGCGEVIIRALRTGDPARRGEVVLLVSEWEGMAAANLTIGEARRVAEKLLEFADICERFSTRGYAGSKE